MLPSIESRPLPAVQDIAKAYGVPSPALLALCRAALVARIEADVLRPRILAIQVAALAEGNYQAARPHLGYITDPSLAYALDEAQFGAYYAACAARYRAAGYKFADQQCPLAIAEQKQLQAEIAFGLACAELRTGIDPEEALRHSNRWMQYLELMFRIVTRNLPCPGPSELRFNRLYDELCNWPQPEFAGLVQVTLCPGCGKNHDVKVDTFTDRGAWYFTCPATAVRVDLTEGPRGRQRGTECAPG